MNAAVVHSPGASLTIEDRPDPQVGPDQGLVRSETSGRCRSDVYAVRDDWVRVALEM
jgi:D-arabinose 1-dehydrogenase-like Zn-dependent alcohol dehydrogenase